MSTALYIGKAIDAYIVVLNFVTMILAYAFRTLITILQYFTKDPKIIYATMDNTDITWCLRAFYYTSNILSCGSLEIWLEKFELTIMPILIYTRKGTKIILDTKNETANSVELEFGDIGNILD